MIQPPQSSQFLILALIASLLATCTACKWPARNSNLPAPTQQKPTQLQSVQQALAQRSVAASPMVYTQTASEQFASETHDGIPNIQTELSPKATDRLENIEEARSSPPESSMGVHEQQSIPTPAQRAGFENQAVALASMARPSISATPTTINAGVPESPKVRLAIAGVRPGKGPVRVAIFTDALSFPNPASARETFTLNADRSTAESDVSVVGDFAVGVYQDINGDGELNRNRFGIPLEPFAFSNNAMGQRGPPKFADAAIVRSTNTTDGPTLVPIQLP